MDRIKRIESHLTTCLDCNFSYLPIGNTYEYDCPKCEDEEFINDYDDDIFEDHLDFTQLDEIGYFNYLSIDEEN